MNPLPEDMENTLTGSQSSHASARDVHSINPTQLMARIESYEGREKKGISDVRRTFCLFVTFDLLFVTLLWIIELNVNGGIENTLEKEVVQYDYYSSYFDIFLLAVFRFKVLILAYAVCRLRHWWAIALTTAVTSAFLLAKVILSKLFSQGAFGYVLPIISFILAWIETWFLDFKVLPQEAEEENRLLIVQDASERAALIPGGLSDGQFYSPPESEADFLAALAVSCLPVYEVERIRKPSSLSDGWVEVLMCSDSLNEPVVVLDKRWKVSPETGRRHVTSFLRLLAK